MATAPGCSSTECTTKHPANTNRTSTTCCRISSRTRCTSTGGAHTDRRYRRQRHGHNPISGKAPAPKAKPSAGGGFGSRPRSPRCRRCRRAPRISKRSTSSSRRRARIATPRRRLGPRDAAREEHGAQRRRDAHQGAGPAEERCEARRDQEDGRRRQGEGRREAAEKKKYEGPVTLESLKEKLEATATEDKTKLKTDFEAKQAELKARLESQKAVLQDQTDAQVKAFKDEQAAKKANAEKAWEGQKASLEEDARWARHRNPHQRQKGSRRPRKGDGQGRQALEGRQRQDLNREIESGHRREDRARRRVRESGRRSRRTRRA